MQKSSPSSPPQLLSLAPEIRLKIWHFYYMEVERPRLRYAADFGGVETSTEIEVDLLYTCKQIYNEAWPILLASVQLNIVYMGHSPSQLEIPPPRCLRNQVREICFHCPDPAFWGEDRPPKRPLKFHEFPKLATFRVCRAMRLKFDRLRNVKIHGEDITPSLYSSLEAEKRVALWQKPGVLSGCQLITEMGEFGRGGWLSRIVEPMKFNEPVLLEPDHDSECDSEEWQHWSKDVSWGSFNELDGENPITASELDPKAQDELCRFQGVIAQMHTWVEAELRVTFSDDAPERCIDTLLAVVDTKTKEITELRMLDDEEMKERERWSAEST